MNRTALLIAWSAAGLLLTACGEQPATDEESAPDEESTAMQQEPPQQEPMEGEPADAPAMAEEPAREPAMPQNGVSNSVAMAVASSERPAEDRTRDADRKPEQVLAFYGVEPGMTVLEFVAAGGYYTEILARAVGEDGHVYATRLEEARIADDRLPNVTAVSDREWGLDPGSVDLVFTALNYHDLFNIEDLDRGALLAQFYEVLKPGGTLAVIDHAAEEGSGTRDTDTLHRVEQSVVVAELEDAGFELADESDVLRHAEDDRTQNVFDEGIRGKTDRFVLKFVKPAG